MADNWLVREKNSLGGYKESHPSYGVIGVSRVSGQSSLFDSDVKHQHFIRITLQEASKESTGFTHEYVHGRKRLAVINMSFAQFAQMITTQNVGDGTPCTIEYVNGDEVQPWITRHGNRPCPPDPKPFIDKFSAVGKERAEQVLKNVNDALKRAEAMLEGTDKPTKSNIKEIVSLLLLSRQDVDKNLPYLMECLDEEMECKLSNAVTEFESYVTSSLVEKGLEHIRGHAPCLSVGQQKAIGTGEKE